MLDELSVNLNFNYYRRGDILKIFIVLMFMFSLIINAVDNISYSSFKEKMNNVITLRVLGVVDGDIWDDLGVKEDSDFYFNDYNFYECSNFKINNDYCSRIIIDNDFPYHIKETSIIRGYAYIFNDSDIITKENSQIIAKNYIIDENYSYNKETGLIIDNDCIVTEENDCVVLEEDINNIIYNLGLFYDRWVNKNIANLNYDNLSENIDHVLNTVYQEGESDSGNPTVPIMPYNASRIVLTTKILNDLNISFDRSTALYYNHNIGMETDFGCELYKLTGYSPRSETFNMDLCELENTFSNPNNILGVEKRVMYQKIKPRENTNLYFDDVTRYIREKEEYYESDLEVSIPNLYLKLTNEWSNNLIVNAYILNYVTDIDLRSAFRFAKNLANQNLWELTSVIINKTFQFYEKKTKAKAKIKQLMELKSIGLLSSYRWQELGFNSYKNNIKSEIEVDELIELYNDFYKEDLGTLSEKYKKIFTDSGYNILFLANLLKKLNLKMINGKIYHDYDAGFIVNLMKIKKENELNSYKSELLERANSILSGVSGGNKDFLPLFFKLQTLNKLIEVLRTNGLKKTIPEFRLWLIYQYDKGIYKDIYSQFSLEYIKILDRVIDTPEEEVIASYRESLINSYDILLKKSEIAKRADYNELMRIYSQLEDINIITTNYTSLEDDNKGFEYLVTLREITSIQFQNMIINNKNIFYHKNTNLYFIYNPYKENINLLNSNNGLNNLIKETIIIINKDDDVFKDIISYSKISYYLSDILISSHHLNYKIAGEIIKNLSFSEKQGVNFSKWVEALNQYGFTVDNIWSFFGLKRNFLLTENAHKNIDVDILVDKYKILNRAVKEYIGLETYLYSNDYDISSMFFDPITSLLLSRILVEKGYYIDKDENDNDAIFNTSGEVIYLSLEIDSLIREIGDKYDLFNADFNNIFSNNYLNDFLGNINSDSDDLNKMMKFIRFSYTKDLRTGERNISFTFGVDNINDEIIWSRISGSVSNVSGFWGTAAKISSKFGIPGILLGATIGIAGGYYFGKYMDQKEYDSEQMMIDEVRLNYIHYDSFNIYENEEWVRYYINRGLSDGVIKDMLNDNVISSKKIYDGDKLALKNIKIEIDKAKKDSDLADAGDKKKYKANLKKLEQQEKEMIKKTENDKKEYEKNIQNEKDAPRIIKKIREEEKDKKNKSKPNKMCRADTYNNECDSGIGPSGDPRLILSKKGGLARRLLELLNRRITNIPPQECNVITKVCGSTIEVTTKELQKMIKSIADEASSNDESCKWSPLNGCSYFDGTNTNGISYIDLLWDPVPPFVEE